MITRNIGYQYTSNKANSYVTTVTAAAKGTRTCLWSKKIGLQITRNYEIYNPQALSSTLALPGCHSKDLRVINSVDPCVFKSNYYLSYTMMPPKREYRCSAI